MKILFIGDVVGRSGRDMVAKHLPRLKAEHAVDCAIVNGENAAHGFGITPQICKAFFADGADVVTGGDHIWDQKETLPFLSREKRLLRPHNFPDVNPGSGVYVHECAGGRKILIIHLLGQIFTRPDVSCPFAMVDAILKQYPMPGSVSAIFVDFHGEATSEKCAIGLYLDGRVSAVIGTHTHIPTADGRILPNGTAYQTDAGMCGDYNSVIGMKKEAVIARFLTKNIKYKMEVADGKAEMRAILIETDDKTGLALTLTHVDVM